MTEKVVMYYAFLQECNAERGQFVHVIGSNREMCRMCQRQGNFTVVEAKKVLFVWVGVLLPVILLSFSKDHRRSLSKRKDTLVSKRICQQQENQQQAPWRLIIP